MTTLDFPGELSAVIFCQGCPWRCRYCHNSELIPRRGKTSIPWSEVIEFLQKRRGLLDAVVFSGGEPTLQRALPSAISQVKAIGYKIGLHTGGPYPERLKEILPYLDWVGLDIKAMEENYAEVTGVKDSGKKAWESAKILIESGVAHEIRTTVHPALTSSTEQQKNASPASLVFANNVIYHCFPGNFAYKIKLT
jgi:pyruvate formate lyase activating enzyme